jgi:ParB family chromosome partitioning protein
MAKEKRLGRGLDTLLGASPPRKSPADKVEAESVPRETTAEAPAAHPSPEPEPGPAEDGRPASPTGEAVQHLNLDQIKPNPLQPRREFDNTKLKELADSIRSSGVLQPIVVREKDGTFQVIAGERRLRASRLANRRTIPAIVRQVPDDELLELALIENIQRADLNPMEKSRAFWELSHRYNLTHEQIAERVGSSRSNITNFLRLLDLPEEIQALVQCGDLSMGHARAILGLPLAKDQVALAEKIMKEDLSVRQTEDWIARIKRDKPARRTPGKDPVITDLEERFRTLLGTKVSITDRGGKGRIVVEYYSVDQFNDLIGRLGVPD